MNQDPSVARIVEILGDRPIAFHRCLARVAGSIIGGLLLSQALYWQRRCLTDDGWWWKTQREWEEETLITRRELETARKNLDGILLFDRRGIPAKNFYRIDTIALHSRLLANDISDRTNSPSQFARNSQTTNIETTSETTSETIPASPGAKPGVSGNGEGGSEESDPKKRHKLFIDLWTESFEQQFGRPYVFNGGKDGSSLKRLLASSKLSAGDLMKIATRAWAKTGPKFWACEKAVTITAFCARLNEIQSELEKVAPGDIPHRNNSATGVRDQDSEALYSAP